MSKPSLPCESCRANVYPGDQFCDACGAAVREARMLQLAEWERGEAEDARALVRERRASVRKASRMLALLAALFLVTGLGAYVFQRAAADKALRNLHGMQDHEVFPTPIEGVTYSVRDLRAKLDSEPRQILAVNLTLALVMGGLFVWSRRAAFAALVTAIGALITLWFVSFLIDPATILQGLIIKIGSLIALSAGLRAALAERAAALRTEASE